MAETDWPVKAWLCGDCGWVGNRPKEEPDHQEGWEEPWTLIYCPECGDPVTEGWFWPERFAPLSEYRRESAHPDRRREQEGGRGDV
jgi:rRNA maturation protein Nop10